MMMTAKFFSTNVFVLRYTQAMPVS